MAVTEVLAWIGAISGVAGSAISVAAYRRAGTLKSIDLRLELRTLLNQIRAAREGLPSYIDRANASRRAALAARGLVNSSAWTLWEHQVATDKVNVTALAVPPDQDFASFNHRTLENALISARNLERQVKCRRALNFDQALSFNFDQGLSTSQRGATVDNYSPSVA